jgi:hypothetical protein
MTLAAWAYVFAWVSVAVTVVPPLVSSNVRETITVLPTATPAVTLMVWVAVFVPLSAKVPTEVGVPMASLKVKGAARSPVDPTAWTWKITPRSLRCTT